MFWSPYGRSPSLWLSTEILSDPKDACSHACFDFELSAQNYLFPTRVERYFFGAEPLGSAPKKDSTLVGNK